MPIANTLGSLFGKSPIKPIQEHMAVAHQAVEHLGLFFDAVKAHDWATAAAEQKIIGELENRADAMKKEIRLQLPKSLFLPVPRTDLLELISVQDRLANRAKDIAGIMLGRQMTIPAAIENEMLEFVRTTILTSAQALKAIRELSDLFEAGFGGREVNVVAKMIEELDRLEHVTDTLQIAVRSNLFKVEKELHPIDVMFFYRVIEWVGDVGDRAQKVGSRLQLLLAR